jgi:hypothetical protein
VFINVVSDLTRLGGFFHAAVRTAAAAAAARPRRWGLTNAENPEGNLLVTLYIK